MDVQELHKRQRWSLKQKIDHSLFTIETYISRTEGQCYVAFSGGKDSSVLLDLVRMIDPTIPAVFVNTGNEYPEIIKFVRHLRDDKGYNIIELTPKMRPREVWSKYGFPLISKAQAEYIDRWRKNPAYGLEQQKRAEAKGWAFGRVSDRWKYLIYEPYHTSNLCCDILKKNPAKKYEKETGRHPILGMMASESNLRQTEYIHRGGVILSERIEAESDPHHWQFGQMMIFGNTSERDTLRLQMSITKEQIGQDVLDVALDVSSRMIQDLICFGCYIPNIIR